MATVWRGYDTVLDRLVAIKQIRPDRHYSPEVRRELVERFRREARVTAKIEHPGVPAVYDAAIDVDEDDIERLYLVMQFVHGVTLSDLLAEHGMLPIPWAVAIAAQVCTVLSHAHAIPVVHRDLKPSNIMIANDGSVKVLDFGVAAVLGTGVTRLTETGQIIGSRDYMAPEQFYGVGVTPRSDLYALGCLLHEMLTGRKVFDSARDPALQHVHERPTPVRHHRPEVDEQMERLILDLLAKAPDDRPASAQEVFERLSPFLPALDRPRPAGSRRPAPTPGIPDPTRPYRRPLAPRDHDPTAPPSADSLFSPPPDFGRIAPPSADIAFGPLPDFSPLPEEVVREQVQRVLDELTAAEEHAASLIEEARFNQAVRVLDQAIEVARERLATDHPRLLELRHTHAAALFLANDYAQALTAFERLAAAYARVGGPDDARGRECRRQAAYCHAELGDVEAALTAFRALLDHEIQYGRGTRSDEALEIRLQIGTLLLSAYRLDEAADVLRALRRDLVAVRGEDASEVGDVEDLLRRIDLSTC